MTHSEFSQFSRRHIGPCASELDALLQAVGSKSLDSLMDETVPEDIRLKRPMALPPALTETQALSALEEIMGENQVLQSLIGTGYYGTVLPPVIQRNVLENPGWYTAYTPYQAEISQGRMEALLNFQTMVCDLTGMEISNASLLDEATAAAEAMAMCHDLKGGNRFFVADDCHPQTLALLQTRAEPLGLELTVGDPDNADFTGCVGVIIQYPSTCGRIRPIQPLIAKAQAAGAMAIVATDLLALTLITPPGEVGADIVVGSAQRFGVPFGYGGPHAAFLATKDAFKRRMPGRLIGVSKDAEGNHALRLTLQTREQHIRREKATSNICTAQVLLAVIASLYAVYHGPEGLRAIAESIHEKALDLANRLLASGYEISTEPFFDTLAIKTGEKTEELLNKARRAGYNLRPLDAQWLGLSLDETVESIDPIAAIFDAQKGSASLPSTLLAPFARKSAYLAHPVFNTHHTESELMRYIKRLETKDLSLTTSMIPLGSCTMKLNAAAEMFPVTWKKVGGIHPLAPVDQAKGYGKLFANLENWLGEITGLPAVSLQPNAGSQGEYAGLLVIRAYHHNRGEAHRNICLIPVSAHGTNPASAVMAGFEVVGVACDELGNVNLQDLETKAETHKDRLGALMVTYPSTHGVFEETIARICEIIHLRGGQVYLDGANMNAQVGICRPGDFGADVCHLNLHKTFCIPHGGGGPGVGPICAAPHLAPYLPGHNLIATGGSSAIGPVSQAPWGSASILVIPWMYIAMMGPEGLTEATKVAILNANYIAKRLAPYYKVLYTGKNGRVAHECIIDIREWKARAGIEVEDVAKRLMDFGFHAPTMSWPVPGTLMIEPTESESKAELDRFCEAMILIHAELTAIESGALDKANNPLKNAPHTAKAVISDQWDRPYSREQAAYPADWLREHKFWPSVARVDNVYGDRNIFCTCVPMEA